MKLIRVGDGLYRNENGSVRVAYQLKWRGEPAHWVVRYETWMSVKVEKKFPTLREAREYLKTSHAFS